MKPIAESSVQTGQQLTWIEINQGALQRNLEKIKMLTMPTAEILAVVKANGYGHGLLEVASSLQDQVCYFGVATIEEALMIRFHHIQTPILLFGVHFDDQIKQAIENDVTLSISGLEQARCIQEQASGLERAARVHIKIDTGMGRLGIRLQEAYDVVLKIKQCDKLQLEGIYTHFPEADDDDRSFTEKQIGQFETLLTKLSERRISFAYRHAANSAGVLCHRGSHFNLVRPGITLFGIFPDTNLNQNVTLEPVLSWRARVILVKTLQKGESVGYGRTFVAPEDTQIAIIPVGYSHGYPFSASSEGAVLFEDHVYPVVGRVSMDYLAIEVKNTSIKIGGVVTLLGRDHSQTISAESIAMRVKTIPYEIVTRISPMIPRVLLES